MSVISVRSHSISHRVIIQSFVRSISYVPAFARFSALLHQPLDLELGYNLTKFTAGKLQTQYTKFHYCSLCQKWAVSQDANGHYLNPALKEKNKLLTDYRKKDYGFNKPLTFYPNLAWIARYSSSSDSKIPDDKTKTDEQAAKPNGTDAPATAAKAEPEKLSIYQRFKRTYKEHGKILVAVHVATSIVWYGSFYVAARSGIDIVPYLESAGFSEKIINPFRAGGLGDYALAYLMYKLATPARYTVTIAGTNMVIRLLRSRGKIPPKSEEDSLRELVRQGRKQLDSKLRRERRKKTKAAREAEKAKRGKSSV